jgi:hypothetical protein
VPAVAPMGILYGVPQELEIAHDDSPVLQDDAGDSV